MLRSVTVRVAATTANLGPGFDCLGMALQMYNEVQFVAGSSDDLRVEVVDGSEEPQIPTDERNLVYRAASRVFELARRRPASLTIKIRSNTPLARGLGGSAAAIVAGAVAANKLLEEPFTMDQLIWEMVQIEGHPDNVVACVTGGLVAAITAEGRVLYHRYELHPKVRCVLVVPSYELSTRRSRATLPKNVSLRDAVFNLSRVPLVIECLCSGELEDLGAVMEDRLHQPFRKLLIRNYDPICVEAERAGAKGVCLSGAGPTMVAWCYAEHAEAVADAMRNALSPVDPCCRTIVTAPDLKGVQVLEASV